MKKIIVLLAGSIVAFGGSAYAAGCHYEKSDDYAKASPIVDAEGVTDPKLLALLKNQKDEAKEALRPTFN